MGNLVSDQLLDRIRQANDVVALIRETVSLKKAGSGFVGLCPFHREKTPSFHVNAERQIFKCFGCGVGGDVFSFVMKHDGLSFPEALQQLAERAHIEIPQSEFSGAPRGEKTKLYDVNKWAADVYHRCLVEHAMGKQALDYLLGRGLTMETIRQFRLGFSPDGWDGLAKAATRHKFPQELLQSAGLLTSNERSDRLYDRFRNRVMFPIFDAQDRVIGFGARALDDSEPKYLNSPETPLFSKGRTLYGVDRARQAFRDIKRAVIVEGYMDVIAAHQYGFAYTVGVLGTALSREHVQLLRRYVDEAILLFDADNAGQSSASRSVDAFAAEEMPVRVAALPDGLDPDEMLKERGAKAFSDCLDAAVDGFAFKLERALAELPAGADASSIARAKALDDVLGTLALLPNAVTRSQEIKRIAARTHIAEWTLEERLNSMLEGQRRRVETRQPEQTDAVTGPARDAEAELLFALLRYPSVAPIIRERLTLEKLERPEVKVLLTQALELAESGQPFGAAELLARTQDEKLRVLLEPMVDPETHDVEDPAVWCRQLMGRIEARTHLDAGRKLHDQIVAGRTPPANADDALRARLEAAREAQRSHGRLELKKQ